MEKNKSKSTAFLVELLIVIMFFAFSGAICAEAFVYANNQSHEVENTQNALIAMQSAAECAKAHSDDMQTLARLLNAERSGNKLTAHYNEDWASVPGNGAYTLTVTVVEERQAAGVLYKATVAVYRGDSELVSVDAYRYVG